MSAGMFRILKHWEVIWGLKSSFKSPNAVQTGNEYTTNSALLKSPNAVQTGEVITNNPALKKNLNGVQTLSKGNVNVTDLTFWKSKRLL